MINFVYFDLGGVVINDFSGTNKWSQLKKELGITPEKDKQFENFWKKYEAKACIGRNIETLLPLTKKEFNSQLPNNYSLLLDGFVNRFETNQSIWPIINKFHQHCRVGLLTNMYPEMLTAIKNKGLLPNISWDLIIDSSVAGVQKPDPKIFQLAEQEANTKAKEILFIENSPQNIKAAQSLGWQTFLYDSSNSVESSYKLSQLCKSIFNK